MDGKQLPIHLFLAGRIKSNVGGCQRTHVHWHLPFHRGDRRVRIKKTSGGHNRSARLWNRSVGKCVATWVFSEAGAASLFNLQCLLYRFTTVFQISPQVPENKIFPVRPCASASLWATCGFVMLSASFYKKFHPDSSSFVEPLEKLFSSSMGNGGS